MRLDDAVGLTVPTVSRLYAPAPVYLVDDSTGPELQTKQVSAFMWLTTITLAG